MTELADVLPPLLLGEGIDEEIQQALDEVGHKLDLDAYTWLVERNPDLVKLFESALRRGVPQTKLNEFIRRRTRRARYNAICEQAIRYIARKLEEGTW